MDYSYLPKARLVNMLKDAEHDLWKAQEEVDRINHIIHDIEDALRQYRICPIQDFLYQLQPFVERLGSWWEQDILFRATNGEELNRDEIERLNVLGIQFIHHVIL